MARIRSLKPTIWESEKVGRMSTLARLSFIGIITLADDHGRGQGSEAFLRSRLHPYANDVDPEAFSKALGEIGESSLVLFYQVDGFSYYAIPGWYEHQRVDHPSKSAIPEPPQELLSKFREASRGPREEYREEGKGEEGRGREGRGRSAAPKPGTVILIPQDLVPWEKDILNWIAYKAEKRQVYKPKGLEALWRSILKIPADKRTASIENSMANNWAGIYEKKGDDRPSAKAPVVGAAAPVRGKYDKISR